MLTVILIYQNWQKDLFIAESMEKSRVFSPHTKKIFSGAYKS